ncbi:MAG: helix-turn-helix domain-containing protein, partial [Candidatus Acidiferrum sp.]
REDIVPLMRHFVDMYGRRLRKIIEHIPPETVSSFVSYSWPGNIRELQNVIERAVILSDDGVLPNPLPPARTEPITAIPVRTTLRDSERILILQALEMSGWVIGGPGGAAARLGLKRTTLIGRMKKNGICRHSQEHDRYRAVGATS